MKGYFTTKEAGERLDITPDRVRQLIAEGQLKSEKFGRDNFIPEAELKEFEKNRRRAGRPPKETK